MVIAANLPDKPALEFLERHRRFRFRIISVPRRNITSGRPRQKPHFAGHGADEALDMRAIVRRTTWPDVRIDTIGLARASKHFRAVRSGMIGM